MAFDPKQYWADLQPKHKRYAMVGLTTIVVGGVILGLPDGSPEVKEHKPENVRSILTSTNTREIGMDAVMARQKMQESRIKELTSLVEKQAQLLQDLKDRRGDSTDAEVALRLLQGKVGELEDHAKRQGWIIEDIKDGYIAPSVTTGGVPANSKVKKEDSAAPTPTPDVARVADGMVADPNHYFKTNPVRPVASPAAGSPNDKPSSKREKGANQSTIRTIESVSQINEEGPSSPKTVLPTGSIISGQLLNGMDAPTGMKAADNPGPVLVRVDKEAILPNHWSAAVEECFITMSGYGDLSSERAHFRTERLSCMRDDQTVLDIPLKGYATGEDGKAGLRGKVVHRTGALLANSLLAGFGAGLSEAFGSTPVPTLATGTASSDRQYQSFNSGTLNYGLAKGASESLSNLSDYYLELAEQIFPCIEINAFRSVDIILTSSVTLEFK